MEKKKSLFSKIMMTYVVIIAISYSIAAIFLSVWFYKYYYDQRTTSLLREEANLNKIVTDYMVNGSDVARLKFEISVIDRLLNARVLVVDNYGFIVGYSGAGFDDFVGKQITTTEIEEIRKGKIVVKTGSLKEIITAPVLTVGMPVVINDRVQAAVLLHSPLDDIKKALRKVYLVIWMSAFFTMLFSAYVIYYFSDRSLIKPLAKINDIAKSITKGEFEKRVEIDSDDEIGELADSFNYMADSLQNLESMRRSFIANISHELRSPMTSINGFIIGMIDGTIPQDKWQYYLGIVGGEIKRLTRLINDTLDLARLESGEFSLKVGHFDLNKLITERVITFEERITQSKINMDVILIENKVMVVGDRDRIDQVITNLLDNAIKFTPKGGTIKIKTQIRDSKVVIGVFNSGSTIPKEEIKYIWDRFHKVDKARSKGGGTGLGLSIARQIINQHNETIWVESYELGTEFSFTLSLK